MVSNTCKLVHSTQVSFCLIDGLLEAFTHDRVADEVLANGQPEEAAENDAVGYFRARSRAVGHFGALCDSCSLLSDVAEQQLIDAFALSVRTKYAFLLRYSESAVLCGTREFVGLPPVERTLLCALVHSVPHAHVLDIPVYLPRTSPTTPYRFLALEMVTNLFVCILIGKDPLITDVIAQVRRCVESMVKL